MPDSPGSSWFRRFEVLCTQFDLAHIHVGIASFVASAIMVFAQSQLCARARAPIDRRESDAYIESHLPDGHMSQKIFRTWSRTRRKIYYLVRMLICVNIYDNEVIDVVPKKTARRSMYEMCGLKK